MPIPQPETNESKDAFFNRCMGDRVMISEYSDTKQRIAVCIGEYDKAKSDDSE